MLKIMSVIILFLILGGLLVYQNFFINGGEIEKNNSQILKIGDNAIYVADQKPGSFVVINFVVVNKNGYVVIYDNIRGRPGNTIGGTKLLPEGESRNVVASLARPVLDGESLFAIIHEDSGDGVFSPTLDVPFRDEEQNIIFMRFSIDRSASEADDVKLAPISGQCIIGGCSGQLCVDESEGNIFSTCEWREEYACYRTARCERQSDRKCGWTPTSELIGCLRSSGSL